MQGIYIYKIISHYSFSCQMTGQSSLSVYCRKANSTRGNSVPELIMRSTAAELCEVKVICQGKEIKMEETVMERVPSKSPKVQERTPSKSPKQQRLKKDQSNDPFACICFFSKPKTNS